MENSKKLGPNFSIRLKIFVDVGVNSYCWLIVVPHLCFEGVEVAIGSPAGVVQKFLYGVASTQIIERVALYSISH